MKYSLLDCTLRDGGYIPDWEFDDEIIQDMIHGLVDSNMDYIEVGYLNRTKPYKGNTTQFDTITRINSFLPQNRKKAMLLAMADVQQFSFRDLEPYEAGKIDGIRVVFYKHQVEEALELAKEVKSAGYRLFMQPMVTIDYSIDEYSRLGSRIAELEPYAVSIVDSFGYMFKEDFRQYFKVLDNILGESVTVGFHSHNNMNLTFATAQDILEYNTQRKIIIDSSLYGMGRGAGNLNTEIIANYYNMVFGEKYDMSIFLKLISRYIMPIYAKKQWGYSPYLFLTGLYHYHPNFACYLLEEHPEVTVEQFERFLKFIPSEYKTKCRRAHVLEMWEECQRKEGIGFEQNYWNNADKAE